MHLPHNSVVLVADGRKMLFLRNEGDVEFPNLVVEKAQEQDNPATRDQATDSAGRASSPQGGVQSSVEPTDFHQIEEDRFAADAADFLKSGALKNTYDSLIVVAPPKILGELRKHYHKEVVSRLKGELDKDLTGHSIKDIEKALKNA
ncbi:host attachment family protein [Sphingomonas sp. PP-CE-1G-424]|uniref:host attachment family protein n=1 Tax=Sphingomonas sp. PP-CE-1G-424 TaxID=2135658 RepID=UPI001054BB09|nr:host attachment family protein [Sphingomonas sp. PP-CE-1G-424]TCP67855.1 protein required for attachment to host cells [Sphingomonas sp. PP-CE-1G-424]